MRPRADFAAWLRTRGVRGVPDCGGVVAVRRALEADCEANVGLLAEVDRLHDEYSDEVGLPRVVGVAASRMAAEHLAALAGVVFAGAAQC